MVATPFTMLVLASADAYLSKAGKTPAVPRTQGDWEKNHDERNRRSITR